MRARERYDVCAAERPEGSEDRLAENTIEQDVDLSAVSAVVDVSSADGRQQCPSNGRQSTLELPPTEPSGIRSAALSIERANQQSVALCDLTK